MMRRPAFAFMSPAIVVLLMASACRAPSEEEVESETVVPVKTAAAVSATLRGSVHAAGTVTPAAGAELIVVAPEAARVAEMPKAAGDRVRRGDLLVRFDMPATAADVQRQRAEVQRAEAALDTARKATTRARELFERGVAARKEVEESERAVADATAAVAQASATLGAAQALSGRSVVRATFDGVVAKRFHNPGDLVEPAASDPILRVIDPQKLEVTAAVPLADAPRVVLGANARVDMAGATVPPLKVVSTPSAVEPGTPTVPIRLAFARASGLPAGMPVQVEIDAEEHAQVVTVPSAAIVRDAEETAIFIANNGKAERRPVKVGLVDGEQVEVVSGVKVGEQVIVEGQNGLPDGAAIALDTEPSASASEKSEAK